MLIFKVDGTFICFVVYTWNLQSSFFSFRRECLDLEGLSLRETKYDLRESHSLGSDLSSP